MQVEQDILTSALVRVYILGPLEIWKRTPLEPGKLLQRTNGRTANPLD